MAVTIGAYTFATLDSTAEVAALKAALQQPPFDTMTDDTAAREVLRRPLVDNQAAAPQVPDPAKVNVAHLLGMLTEAELALIPEDSLARVMGYVEAFDVATLAATLAVWKAKAYISPIKYGQLLAEVTATINDTNHPAQVPGDAPATVAVGRIVSSLTPLDVTRAKELG